MANITESVIALRAELARLPADPCPDCGIMLYRSSKPGRCPECGCVSKSHHPNDSDLTIGYRAGQKDGSRKLLTRLIVCADNGYDTRTLHDIVNDARKDLGK